MKALLFFTIMIFLFTATTVSYAGPSDPEYNERASNNQSGFFSGSDSDNTSSGTNASESPDQTSGFFSSPNADNPGGRPGDGGGIGQQAPLRDGLNVLVACCVLFGFVKFFNEKRKK